MTPGARLEAAIELLGVINQGGKPADDVVGEYFRRHRFAGVKDRAAISEHIYAVLRHRASIDWWIGRMAPALPTDARTRLFAALILIQEWKPENIEKNCDGDRFRPYPLKGEESRMVAMLVGCKLAHRDMPPDVRGDYPAWLHPHLEAALGRRLEQEIAALNEGAQLDLRVNLLKADDRERVRVELEHEGVRAMRTALSPLGLRVFERIPLSALAVFKSGAIEVQDEGSQIASLMVDARPGMRVIDFCAGAGGKTLAIAASMRNRGHLIAADISSVRLERATQRLRRAGASIVQRHPLAGHRDKWVKRHAESFDRVLVDAPCTGTGTWRRNPDAKWRLKPIDLTELVALQADILDSAQRLVKPGGRLIYVTCSLLREEDEEQVEHFLAAHPDFTLVPIARIWRQAIGGEVPVKEPMLRLTPARNGTDGFFTAVLERAPKVEVAEHSGEDEAEAEAEAEAPGEVAEGVAAEDEESA